MLPSVSDKGILIRTSGCADLVRVGPKDATVELASKGDFQEIPEPVCKLLKTQKVA